MDSGLIFNMADVKEVVCFNLGPRVFSDKAADEDPGKIHFIFPKFWRKKRMRSEAQRMLLIKNNAGAYYFWNKLQIACLWC